MKPDLHARSSAMARRAIKHFLDGETDGFLHLAAVAFELLVKARLAEIHPALIAADRDFDALLHLCGAGAHTKTPSWRIRTIGAREAFERCQQIEPTLQSKPMSEDMNLLAALRNSIVHLGTVPAANVRRIFESYLRASALLVKHVGLDRAAYFGDFESVVTTHLDDAARAVTVEVTDRLARSATRFGDRFANLTAEQVQTILQAIEAGIRIHKYTQVLATCPACKQKGILGGVPEVSWIPEVGPESEIKGRVRPSVTLIPQRFACPFCGLTLKGDLEVEAARLNDRVPLRNVNPWDFVEPEQDYDERDDYYGRYEPPDPEDYEPPEPEPPDPEDYEPPEPEPPDPEDYEPPAPEPPDPEDYEPPDPRDGESK